MKKEAYYRLFGLNKRATSVGNEFTASYLSGMLPYVGPLVGGIGDLAGRLGQDDSSTASYDSDAAGWIPGISNYRLARRRNQAAKLIGAKKNQSIHQILGSWTGTLLGALGGAAVGGGIANNMQGPGATVHGAYIGAMAGIFAPNVIGALLAAFKRKRTQAEQKEYEEEGTLGNYLIPGAAVYNNWKNLGFLMGDEYKQIRDRAYSNSKSDKIQPKQKEPKKVKKVTFS